MCDSRFAQRNLPPLREFQGLTSHGPARPLDESGRLAKQRRQRRRHEANEIALSGPGAAGNWSGRSPVVEIVLLDATASRHGAHCNRLHRLSGPQFVSPVGDWIASELATGSRPVDPDPSAGSPTRSMHPSREGSASCCRSSAWTSASASAGADVDEPAAHVPAPPPPAIGMCRRPRRAARSAAEDRVQEQRRPAPRRAPRRRRPCCRRLRTARRASRARCARSTGSGLRDACR